MWVWWFEGNLVRFQLETYCSTSGCIYRCNRSARHRWSSFLHLISTDWSDQNCKPSICQCLLRIKNLKLILQHDHKKMKPFLVTNLLFIVISLLDLIFYINSIWSKNVDPNRTGLDVTIGIIVRSILFAIIVYIFLTVRSLSMMVKTTDPPPPPPCDDTTAENEVTLTAVSSPSKEAETQIHLEPVQKYWTKTYTLLAS